MQCYNFDFAISLWHKFTEFCPEFCREWHTVFWNELKTTRLFILRPTVMSAGCLISTFGFYLHTIPCILARVGACGCTTPVCDRLDMLFFYPWDDGKFSEGASRLFSERFALSSSIIVTSNSELAFKLITSRIVFFSCDWQNYEVSRMIFFFYTDVLNAWQTRRLVSEVSQPSARWPYLPCLI